MVTESAPVVVKRYHHQESYRNYFSMEPTGRAQSPTDDKVSSAADAMLKLSASAPNLPVFVVNPEAVAAGMSALPTIGQPPVAYMAQQHDGATQQAGELEVKPDLSRLKMSAASRQAVMRKQREFIPEFKKDDHYWMKRRKNNEAAKRSREKRRANDMQLSDTISKVRYENEKLRREMQAIKQKFGLPLEQIFPYDMSEQLMIQSPSDSSDNNMDSSPHHHMMAPMTIDTSSSGPVFPSPISAPSPLQDVLRSPHVAPTPTPLHHPTVGIPTAAPTIPFLIPVSSTNPQQPLALVTHVPTTAMSLNPAIVTSLTLPPGVLPNIHALSATANTTTNGHDVDYNRSTSNGTLTETASIAGYHHHRKNTARPAGTDRDQRHSAALSTDGGSSPPPHGNLRIVTSSGSDLSEDCCDDSSLTTSSAARSSAALNLCKKEKDDASPPHSYIEIKPCPLTPPMTSSPSRTSIPHKLRHKLAQHLRERVAFSMYPDEQVGSASGQLGGQGHPVGVLQGHLGSQGNLEGQSQHDSSPPEDYDELEDDHLGLVKQEDSSSSDGMTGSPSARDAISYRISSIDPKYTERRRRNNQAARKCRENRKSTMDMRMAKSNVLETENQRLKEELQNLSSEVSTLKDLIDMKNAAKAKGELFDPPAMKKRKACTPPPTVVHVAENGTHHHDSTDSGVSSPHQ